EEDAKEAIHFAEQNEHCIIEEWVSFDKEISVIFTRSQSGEITFFPIAENDHKEHILYQTTVPASVSEIVKEKAIHAAGVLANQMNIVGTFAIEMFVKDETVYLNEMAPRPHNSGHYSIEACNISQFTQHIRAICGLPLMSVKLLQPASMINILGEDLQAVLQAMRKSPEGFIHLYGKDEAKEKRKMGHVTFIAETTKKLQQVISNFEEMVQRLIQKQNLKTVKNEGDVFIMTAHNMKPEQIENEQLYKNMGLSEKEYQMIKNILKRRPNYTETGIFSAMWSEHCSYK